MIASVRGRLAYKGIDHVVVEVGGVGLRVAVSLQTLAELAGPDIYLLTYLQVREDALTLFGFASESERVAFELCIGVQQVGPKLAMSILSTLTPDELARAVAAEDTARLRRIPGVGQKTAERLVLELRDKFPKTGTLFTPAPSSTGGPGTTEAQVTSALTNLGYRPSEAQKAATDAYKAAPQAAVADLVKRALRALAE